MALPQRVKCEPFHKITRDEIPRVTSANFATILEDGPLFQHNATRILGNAIAASAIAKRRPMLTLKSIGEIKKQRTPQSMLMPQTKSSLSSCFRCLIMLASPLDLDFSLFCVQSIKRL